MAETAAVTVTVSESESEAGLPGRSSRRLRQIGVRSGFRLRLALRRDKSPLATPGQSSSSPLCRKRRLESDYLKEAQRYLEIIGIQGAVL